MKFSVAFCAVTLTAALAVNASIVDETDNVVRRHHHASIAQQKRAKAAGLLARQGEEEAQAQPVVVRDTSAGAGAGARRRGASKCKKTSNQANVKLADNQKNKKNGSHHHHHKSHDTSASSTTQHKHSSTASASANTNHGVAHAVATGNGKEGNSDSSSSSSSGGVLGGVGKGLFNMAFGSSQCKNPNANNDHPNGSPGFLTCGVSQDNRNSPWNPPNVKLSDLKMLSADQAAQSSVFNPCAQYKSHFQKAESATGIPAVMLMSFALQESTCQPHLTGPNGENGMMQITNDKCGGAPGGNCKDTDFNIQTGAKYFKSVLEGQCGGNVLCAMGAYNGWQAGKMTFASATNKQWGCYAQNNLDYLNSMLNGFMQGKSGYGGEYKTFNNLASCS